MTSPRLPARQGVLLLVSMATLAYLAAALVTARRSGAVTTYAGQSVALAWCFGLAGLALLTSGASTVLAGRRPRLAALAIVASLVWFAPVWDGWLAGPAVARTLGMLAASFVFPLLIHLVLAAASRPLPRPAVALVVTTYLLVGVGGIAVMLVRDPYLDPDCWSNCTVNLFRVSSQPELASRLARLQSWSSIVLAAVFAALCIAWLVQGVLSRARRRWEVLPGGVAYAAATIAHEWLLRHHPLEEPADPSFAAVFLIGCAAAMLIAVGLMATLVRARLQRRSVARILATMGQAPPVGALDEALANTLGDRDLRIHYWLPAAGYYSDSDGHQLPDPFTNGAAVATPLVRHGQTVAVVSHRSDPAEVERGFGPAARLALDNERLRAEVRVRVHELAASRARIVEASDARRRSLERDLHDGAQQTLLSMSYDLQVARSAAAASGDAALSELVDTAVDEVRATFAELRDLAHGIYPAVLGTAGLGPAITALADASDVAVDVDCGVDERLPPVVETAAYVVVATILDAAAAGSTGLLTVTVDRHDGMLVLDIAGSSEIAVDADDLEHLQDRVGAAGGRLDVSTNVITARLPCES